MLYTVMIKVLNKEREKVRLISKTRKKQILELLRSKTTASVAELSEHCHVSPLTIRRDLDDLATQGLVLRIRGGAKLNIVPSGLLNQYGEINFDNKSILNIKEKKQIGELATTLIEPDSIVFMNSGSTTLFFLQALHKIRAQILTNNAAAFSVSYDTANLDLYSLGGEYRSQSKSFIGNMTINAIDTINSTYTILGTNGIDIQQGLSTSVYEECFTNQAMVEHTLKKVIVLADYSKFGVVSNFISIPLSKVDIIVTDNKCPKDYIVQLEQKKIDVIIVNS